MRLCAAGAEGGLGVEGMHARAEALPGRRLAVAISELSTAIAFALSTMSSSTMRALGGSG